MTARPNPTGRIDGTTYPRDRAPEGSIPLGPRRWSLRRFAARLLVGASLEVLRPEPGDILVVRSDRSPDARRLAHLNTLLHSGRAGDPVAVWLPSDCAVHLEPKRLKTEDRGYRETATYGADKAPAYGVFTGVPDARDPEDSPC